MRTNPRAPKIHALIPPKRKSIEAEMQFIESKKIEQNSKKGVFIKVNTLPGKPAIFIPEGKDKDEVIQNYINKRQLQIY